MTSLYSHYIFFFSFYFCGSSNRIVRKKYLVTDDWSQSSQYFLHIRSPVTDNCPSWISERERKTVENIPWSNLHERMLPDPAGVEPATSWSPVGRASNWVIGQQSVSNVIWAAKSENVPSYMRPLKIQISLRIRAVWSESSLGEFLIAKDAKFLRAEKETDQTAQMCRLIWLFAGRMHVRRYTLRVLKSLRFNPFSAKWNL